MDDKIGQRYRVEKNEVEKSYEYQIGLKNNEEYEKRVDNTFLQMLYLFSQHSKGIQIDVPRIREKSAKSIKLKIDKLEIERLCLKNVVSKLSNQEMEELYSLISEKTKNNDIEKKIKEILFNEEVDIKDVNDLMDQNDLNNIVKMAVLRITRTKIINSNMEKQEKEKIIDELEEKYGEKAAEKTGKLANNIMHWENVKKALSNEKEVEKINNPQEYLKMKDLRGFRIVIFDVPDDYETENKNLKHLIELRKETKDSLEKRNLNEKCCREIEKDFYNYLINNEVMLKLMNIKLINGKEKNKQNGYFAHHLKFCYLDNEDYTFEVQIRSLHVDNISKANGSASHIKRDDKERELPSLNDKETFLKEIKKSTPRYTILERKSDGISLRKCNWMENIMEYYLGYVELTPEMFDKMNKWIKEESKER